MTSTGRLVGIDSSGPADTLNVVGHPFCPIISKRLCGRKRIRIVNKFSLSLSASDCPGNTISESQKVPLSSWTEQQRKNGGTCNIRLLITLLRMEH